MSTTLSRVHKWLLLVQQPKKWEQQFVFLPFWHYVVRIACCVLLCEQHSFVTAHACLWDQYNSSTAPQPRFDFSFALDKGSILFPWHYIVSALLCVFLPFISQPRLPCTYLEVGQLVSRCSMTCLCTILVGLILCSTFWCCLDSQLWKGIVPTGAVPAARSDAGAIVLNQGLYVSVVV